MQMALYKAVRKAPERNSMRHCILVKYNETVDQAAKEKLLPEIQKVFAPLTEIDGIESVRLFPCTVDRDNRYDLLIRIEMDPAALPAYDDSEPHRIWKRDYARYLEKKAIFDYEEPAADPIKK